MVSKPKYKLGKKIETVADFEKSTCTFFKIGIKTYHRGWLENFQYRVLKNYISSGNLHEAYLIESKKKDIYRDIQIKRYA